MSVYFARGTQLPYVTDQSTGEFHGRISGRPRAFAAGNSLLRILHIRAHNYHCASSKGPRGPPPLALRPMFLASTAASVMSLGDVILMLRRSVGTIETGWPVRSTTWASSVGWKSPGN